jgi:hypothetical protein
MLAPLRTFGGASNASEFCNCSETVRDIANELLHCEDWDPSEVFSPIQHQIPSTPLTMDSSILFVQALPLAVDVPTESIGKADDFIVVNLGDAEDITRGNAVSALALKVVSRPPHAHELVLRGHKAFSANSSPKGAWKKSKRYSGGP